MEILVINFSLEGITESEYQKRCDDVAPAFAGRAELIERVWGTSYVGGSNVVDVVVRSLRQKLGPIANRVEAARGVGYRLN